MCDEFTGEEHAAALSRQQTDGGGLSRRSFATLGAAAALVGYAAASPVRGAEAKLAERTVQVTTPDGVADAFLVHPAAGKHPGVVMWPDIAGLREAFRTMARRLAGAGYTVLVVNQYYRCAPAPVLDNFAQWRTPEGQAKIKPMIARIDPAGITRDAAAFVAFLDTVPATDKARRIGTSGYCMGGPFTVRTAAAVPGRVGAAASFHGAGLVSDDPASPVRLLAATKAQYLFAIARGDDARAPGDKDALKAASAAAHRPAEVEVYPAEHGWTVLDSPVYDKDAAEHAWARMQALFAAL